MTRLAILALLLCACISACKQRPNQSLADLNNFNTPDGTYLVYKIDELGWGTDPEMNERLKQKFLNLKLRLTFAPKYIIAKSTEDKDQLILAIEPLKDSVTKERTYATEISRRGDSVTFYISLCTKANDTTLTVLSGAEKDGIEHKGKIDCHLSRLVR